MIRMKKLFSAVLICFCFLLSGFYSLLNSAAAAEIRERRVVHGERAQPHHFPWMAGLSKTTTSYPYTCSASLIGNRWLMTARHCVLLKNGRLVNPQVFRFKLYGIDDDQLPHRKIKNIYANPGRPKGYDHDFSSAESAQDFHTDFALLETEDEFPEVEKLSLNYDFLEDSDIALLAQHASERKLTSYIAGFGYSHERHSDNRHLNWGMAVLKSSRQIKTLFPGIAVYPNDFQYHFFAGLTEAEDTDTCNGDSGSPLWLAPAEDAGKAEAIGITITGSNSSCGHSGQAGIYLRLSTVKDFIISTKGISDRTPFRWLEINNNKIPDGIWRITEDFSKQDFICRVGFKAGLFDNTNNTCIYLNDQSDAVASKNYKLLQGNPSSLFEWRSNLQGHQVNELTTCYKVKNSQITHSHSTECQAYCLAFGEPGVIHNNLCVTPKLNGRTRYSNDYQRLVDKIEPLNLSAQPESRGRVQRNNHHLFD